MEPLKINIETKFRQIYELNQKVKSEGLVSSIISFPSKTVFGNRFDSTLVEKRKMQLEQYFQYLCSQKQIVESEILRDFLEIDIHVNISNDYMAPTVINQSARATPPITPQRLAQLRTNGFRNVGNNAFQLSNEFHSIYADISDPSIYTNVFKQVTVHGQFSFAQLGLYPLYAYQSLTEPLYVEGYEQINGGIWQKIGYIPLPMTRNTSFPNIATKTTVTRIIPVSEVVAAPNPTPQTTTTNNTITSIKISVSGGGGYGGYGYGYPYY